MTICVGMLAEDGIVIGADAQESDTYFKRSQQKIVTWNTAQILGSPLIDPAACVVAGAGDGGFIDAFTAELLSKLRGDMKPIEFEAYAKETLENFYTKHVRPLIATNPECDFSVLIGGYFGFQAGLFQSRMTTLRRAPIATAIGIGGQYALRQMDEYPFSDVRHTEITVAAVISSTKDCIEGCGKYSDIVSIHRPKVIEGEPGQGSHLEHPDRLWTRVPAQKIARWESSFARAWGERQRKLYEELIEEELKTESQQ